MVSVLAGRRPSEVELLIGLKVEYVRLGPAIVLGLSGGSQLLVETTARLSGPHGRFDIDPGADSADVVATLLGDVVRSVQTSDTGDLKITFGDGSELLVGADADFESWAVVRAGGGLTVCLPGGEVAVWGDS